MAVKFFYLGVFLREHHIPIIPRFIEFLLRYFFCIEISTKMKVGINLMLPHNGLGVVIHPNVQIGDNVKILRNVTIGGKEGSGVPIIKDNVLIGCGAVIVGDVIIGNSAKIGANAVVLNDVPDNSIAVGVPATIKLSGRQ